MFDNYEERGASSSASRGPVMGLPGSTTSPAGRTAHRAAPRGQRHAGARALAHGAEATALVLVTAAVLAFGLAVLYSASAIVAMNDNRSSAYFLVRQLEGAVVGVVAFAIAAKMDAQKWEKWAWPLMWLTIVAMTLALFDRAAHPRVAPIPVRAVAAAVGARQVRGDRLDGDAHREEGRSVAPPHQGGAAVPRGDRAARRARGARARPVGGDAVHAAHGGDPVRRRGAHRAFRGARRRRDPVALDAASRSCSTRSCA